MQKRRFNELEGLRGVAAAVVTLYHFLLAFYLYAFFGPSPGVVQHMRFEDNFHGNPLAVFLSGTFAVAIFFALSGFVLSIGFFQSGSMEIVKKLAAKRYIRLMLPALASTLICFLIISFGVSKIDEAGAVTQSGWLLSIWQFNPTFFEALKSGMFDIFVVSSSPYNNVLWTMTTEFAGSFIIFGFLALFGKLKYRWVGYIFLLIATFNTWFFAFIVGTMIADAYAKGLITTRRRSMKFILPMLGVSLFLGGYPLVGADSTVFYGFFNDFSQDIRWDIMLLSLGAIGLFLIVLLTEQISKIFSHKIFSGLGKYTFAMYLTHIPVLLTVGMSVFLISYTGLGIGYNMSSLVAIAASLGVTVGATLLFERYVDSPSVSLSSKVAAVFLGEKELPPIKILLVERWQAFVQRFKVFQRSAVPDIEEAE